MMVANAELERVTALYNGTSFGVAGPVTTTGYDGLASIPSTRLIYPNSLSSYISGGSNDYITTSSNTFLTGSDALVWVNSQIVPALNRSYVWIDKPKNVIGRVSWVTNTVNPAACIVGGDGCWCRGFGGGGFVRCQKLDLYLEYPYRLSGGNANAEGVLQTLSFSTIVGRAR